MAAGRETLRLIDGLRVQLDATVDAAVRDLVLAWGVAWGEVAAEWDAAIIDLVDSSKDGRWPSRRQVARAERAVRAMRVTREALRQLADDFNLRVLQDIPSVVKGAAEWEARIIASQMPPGSSMGVGGVRMDANYFNRVDAAALDAIVERSTEQVSTLMAQLPMSASRAINATLIRGVALGTNPRLVAVDMAARIRDQFKMPLYRALVIARTEMLDAHRASAFGQDFANSDVLTGWTWVAKLDTRTCESCWAQHGRVFDVDDPGPHDHQQGRCTRVPVTKSWSDLGFTGITEPPTLIRDGRAVFDDLSPADQLAVLGEKKLALLNAGLISWEDLSKRRVTRGWRDSWAPTSMRDLLRVANRRAAS